MRRSTLKYIFYILLTSGKLKSLQKLIWHKRHFKMRMQHHPTCGVVYLNPVNLLKNGLLCGQMVFVSINFTNAQGVYNRKERLMAVESLSTLGLREFLIGDIDRFNIFGHDEVVISATLDSIHPYGTLPKCHKKISIPDTIRISPIRQYLSKNSEYLASSLQSFLTTPRMVYKGDVISVQIEHPLMTDYESRALKIDYTGEAPFILDDTCTLYELSTVNHALPNGGKQIPEFNLPSSMKSLLIRMRSLFLAYRKMEETPFVFLLSGSSGSGKRLLVQRFAALTSQNFIDASCYSTWSEVSAQSEQKIKLMVERAKSYSPCVLYLSNADILAYDQNSAEPDHRVLSALSRLFNEKGDVTVVLSCHSDKLAHIPNAVKSLTLYEFNIPHLDESGRNYLLKQFINLEEVGDCVRNTSGFSLAELFSLMQDIEYNKTSETLSMELATEKAIDKRNAEFADSIGAPKIPSVSWGDVGGLEETKQLVIESIESSLHGEDNLRRSGIILFGPPGCGKTLIAKAVATEFKIAFLSVKGPELLNKYVGQSEENLRKVFDRARQASPCVIFFDEIDSLAPNRGKNGDSGGVMDRIVSQLLSEMDELLSSSECKVFVMAATNRADLLDPSLLTPGRFDKVVNVPPGSSVETKTKILEAVCRKVKLDDDVNLMEIAEKCPNVMTGAELYSVISNATLAAVRDEVKLVDIGKLKLSEARITVGMKHLLSALDEAQKRTSYR